MNKRLLLLLFLPLLFISCLSDEEEVVKFYTDYQEGIKVAVEANQPILLIFAAYASPTGKTLGLLHDPELKTVLKQHVCILLMTDDRTVLANGQTQGAVNTELQRSYGYNFQPCLLKLTPDLQPIGAPGGYMTSKKEFLHFIFSTQSSNVN